MKNLFLLLIESFLLLLIVSFSSCKKKIDNQPDLIIYINDPQNGLKKTEQIGNIKVVLIYKPWQLIAFKRKIIENKTPDLKDKLFFILSFSMDNKELLRQLQFSQYSEMVQVLAFRMREFIEIFPDQQKPVIPNECIFQQTYGMGSANNLLMVFDKTKLIKANSLRVHIKEFGLNTGNMNFEINIKDIKNIPDATLN